MTIYLQAGYRIESSYSLNTSQFSLSNKRISIATGSSSGIGNVFGPATNSDNYVPQWNGANAKTLKNGYPVSATAGASTIALSGTGGTLALGWLPATLTGKDADTLDGSHLAAVPLLAGRATGQTLIGGTGSGEHLTLQSTAHATRGEIRTADKLFVDGGNFFAAGWDGQLKVFRNIDVTTDIYNGLFAGATVKGDVTESHTFGTPLYVWVEDDDAVVATPGLRTNMCLLSCIVRLKTARNVTAYDDVCGIYIQNASLSDLGGTDGVYYGHNVLVTKDWNTAITLGCNAYRGLNFGSGNIDYGIYFDGTNCTYGIDLVPGVFSQAPIRIGNAMVIKGRNVGGDGDINLIQANATDEVELGSPVAVGIAGSSLGIIRLKGSTSGYCALQPQAEAGSVTISFPATTGTVALTSDSRFVTNGDSHDHAGGDGAQVDHTGLSNLNSETYTHLTAANHTDLTDAGATTLHKHDHGGQDGLADDDHTGYALLAGRAGGQTLKGSIDSGENLTLTSTNHATKGKIYLGASSLFDEANNRLGIGMTPAYPLEVLGSTSNTVRAYSSEAVGATSGAGVNVYTTGTPNSADDRLGVFRFAGVTTGTTNVNGAIIQAKSEEAWDETHAGTYLAFLTVPTGGSVTLAERMRISADGNVTVLGAFACNNATPRASAVVGDAAPAGGVGATEGAYDTAAHRDAMITLLNNIRTALINNGIAVAA